MHTNGVVTSPTNLTIQQSNVAGLSNALAGKLGTNPTLAISNTTGLQAALDGKLSTNGTLQVSNVSGLQSALDGKLGFNATNGQVQWTNTNALTFTNGIQVGSNPTNVPASGQIAMQQSATNVASEITMWSADQTMSGSFLFKKQNLQTNWSIISWGNNVRIDANNEHNLRNSAQPASYWSVENNYDSSFAGPQYGDSITETYFTTTTSNAWAEVRGFGILGNHKNPTNGLIVANYPVIIQSSISKRTIGTNGLFWDNLFAFSVNEENDGGGLAGIFYNPSQNTNATIRTDWALKGQITSDVFWIRKGHNRIELRNNPDGFTAMVSTTNGVLIGGENGSNATSRVHLGGNTRIDGAITFDNTTNAATTRTNLGLGGGITTNVSSGTLQFSNGILVGHTP